MPDPSFLQIVGGGVVGSSLTYSLTWLRESRRTADAYRAPQREAIAGIVTAVHELVNSEGDHREAAQALLMAPAAVSDSELDTVINAHSRAVYGVQAAFDVGRVTIVDAVCRESVGLAYNTFILRTRSLRKTLDDVTSENAVELLPVFLENYRLAARQLNKSVAGMVDECASRISPVQSRLNWWRRRGVAKRLKAAAAQLAEELGVDPGPEGSRRGHPDDDGMNFSRTAV